MKFFLEGSYVENLTHTYLSAENCSWAGVHRLEPVSLRTKMPGYRSRKGLSGESTGFYGRKRSLAWWTQKYTYVYDRLDGSYLCLCSVKLCINIWVKYTCTKFILKMGIFTTTFRYFGSLVDPWTLYALGWSYYDSIYAFWMHTKWRTGFEILSFTLFPVKYSRIVAY